MTGSVLVPLKALVMNTALARRHLRCAGAGLPGRARLSGLLGFTPTGALETWVPVVVFAFAFGLSMDYEVFLLLAGQGALRLGACPTTRPSRSACNEAAASSPRPGCSCSSCSSASRQESCSASSSSAWRWPTAVAVDATLVRCMLVPATMTLLGDRNWWAPVLDAPAARPHRPARARRRTPADRRRRRPFVDSRAPRTPDNSCTGVHKRSWCAGVHKGVADSVRSLVLRPRGRRRRRLPCAARA